MIAQRYKLGARVSKHAVAEYAGLDRSGRFGSRGGRGERALLDASGFLWRNLAEAPVVASAPFESKPPTVPPPPPAVPAAPPTASAPPPADKAPTQAAATPLKPSFDVVNVDPSGEAVIAGRSAPNAKVELRDAGKTVAEATADAAGQFVIIPPALAPGDHSLSLAASADKTQPAISSPVAISVPAPPEAKVAASPPPSEPKAAAAASSPTDAAAPAPPAQAMQTVATLSSPAGSRVAIKRSRPTPSAGSWPRVRPSRMRPSASISIDADVADAKTQADGRWSLTIKSGMTPGGYLMRADEINPGGATALRASTRHSTIRLRRRPLRLPRRPRPPQARANPPRPRPQTRSSNSVQTKRVAAGHTLWELSRNYYGDPTHYPVIYEANKWEIHNPNLIYPGQVVVVPKSEPKP